MPTSPIGKHCNGNSCDIGFRSDSPYRSVPLRKTPYKKLFRLCPQTQKSRGSFYAAALTFRMAYAVLIQTFFMVMRTV